MTTMKLKCTVLTASLLVMAMVANSQIKQTMEKEKFTAEQNEVMKVILDMTDAFHKKDLKGVLASYEPNAVIVFEPEKAVSGMDAISQSFQGFFAVNPKFEYSGHEVFINGNLAMHFAPWTMTGKPPMGRI